MAALAAARRGLRVLVLEQTQAPSRQFAMLRRGQGSISHELISHEYFHGRHGRFAIDALGALDADALQALFNELGIELQLDDGLLRHGEKRGHELARTLTAAIEAAGGEEIRCGVTVLGLSRKRTWSVATTAGQFSAKRVVLALGGPPLPATGRKRRRPAHRAQPGPRR